MGKYFSVQELIDSDTAKQRGIKNIPNEIQTQNLENLIKVMDIIREAWGKPIIVNSGYRCPELNVAVKGSKTSHHLDGKAADLTTGSKKDNERLFDLIVTLQKENKIKFTQLIDEKNFSWVHLGIDQNNLKNQILKL